MKPRLITAFVLLLAGISMSDRVGFAEFDLKKWPLWREIRIEPKPEKSGYFQVELDGQVFAGAHQDLADLRVVDQTGAEIPSRIVIQKERDFLNVLPVDMLDRTLAPDGRFSFTLDLGDGVVRHNRVLLSTSAINFSRRVQIETGSDNKTWAVARADGYIFSFQPDSTVKHLGVDYPISTKRFLRITVFNQPKLKEEPIEITGAEVAIDADPEPQLVELPVSSQSRREDSKSRTTVIALDLGYPRIPSTAIDIQTGQTNFHRHIEIEGKQQIEEDPKLERLTWSPVGSGDIYQVSINGYQTRNLRIDYPETRLRYLRIKIVHHDDRAISIDRIKVFSLPRRLLFRAEPGGVYRLFYGNAAASHPRYDLERMIQYIDLAQAPLAGLGPQQGESVDHVIDSEPTERPRPGWLLGTLIAAGLVLGYFIFRLARKTVA